MNPNLQTRIAAIKAECEEILKLSEKATTGLWVAEKTFGDWGFPFQMIVKTPKEDPSVSGDGITLRYGGEIRCVGSDARNARCENDASFIAHSRNVSPAMARVVLATIRNIEFASRIEKLAAIALEAATELVNQWEGKL